MTRSRYKFSQIEISNSKHNFAISPRTRASFALNFPPPDIRGRRECRAPDAPDSRVCNGSGRAHTR